MEEPQQATIKLIGVNDQTTAAALQLVRRQMPRQRFIRYDTTVEFNVDSKAEYTGQSSTRSQKLKRTKQCPFNSVLVKIREVSPERIRVTMEEMICERDAF